MTIQDVISNNSVSDFFKKMNTQCLDRNTLNTFILLKGRHDRMRRQVNVGTVSRSESQVEFSRINYALMDLFDGVTFNMSGTTVPVSSPEPRQSGLEETLTRVVYENKRRRPSVANEANIIRDKLRAWRDTRSNNPAYDPTGRRLKGIEAEGQALLQRIEEEKAEGLEQIVERIANLLSEPVPAYSDLQKAYDLATGRGFNDTYVARNLQARPDDDEVRITIAEKIEGFTQRIAAR